MNLRLTIQDRLEIMAIYHNYARGVDRRDWAALRACYHPDAVINHGPLQGGVDDFVRWLGDRYELGGKSVHYLNSPHVDIIDEDSVVCETYGHAVSLATEPVTELFVRYVDIVERRDSGWAITDHTLVYDLARNEDGWSRSPKASGDRGSDDALYAVLARARQDARSRVVGSH